MDEASAPPELLDLTTAIVVAYAGSHTLPAGELPRLIKDVFATLRDAGAAPPEPPADTLVPAVPVKKSVMPDHLVCLEDGKKLKMLKRHLGTDHHSRVLKVDDAKRRGGRNSRFRRHLRAEFSQLGVPGCLRSVGAVCNARRR